MSGNTAPSLPMPKNYAPTCDKNANKTYTYSELKSDFPGGIIQAMGNLPRIDPNKSFEDVTVSWDIDQKWLKEQINMLKRNKLIPDFIRPAIPIIPTLPPIPQEPIISSPPVPPTNPPMPVKPEPKPRGQIKPNTKSINRIHALFTEGHVRDSMTNPQGFKIIGNDRLIFKNNGEFSFNGSLDNYLVASYSNPSEWTMSWTFTAANNGYYTMVSITNDDLSQPVFQSDIYDSKIRMIYALPNRWTGVKDFTINPPGELNRVIYTYSGSVGKIYVNGELGGRVDGSGPLPKSTKLVIGRSGDSGRGYQGTVSQFSYYDGALSDSQVRDLVREGRFKPEELSSPSDCGTYGTPTADKVLRIYSPDDCIKNLKGTWAQSAICYQDNTYDFETSYSKQCAYLNNPDPSIVQHESNMQTYNDTIARNNQIYNNALADYNSRKASLQNTYKSGLNTYESAFDKNTSLINSYNLKGKTFNDINNKYRKFMSDQYCFYNNMLTYAKNTLNKISSSSDVRSAKLSVNNIYNLAQNLKYKLVILQEIADLTFVDNVQELPKNISPVLEGFRMEGFRSPTDEDINNQYNILTSEADREDKNKRLVEYTIEKNKANQNLLTIFGVLNVVAIGIIYAIASS